jgi:hypothetical protein
MSILKLKISDDSGKTVSTRWWNLKKVVDATCEGEADDDTSLVLVFANGDGFRVPADLKQTVIEKLEPSAQ